MWKRIRAKVEVKSRTQNNSKYLTKSSKRIKKNIKNGEMLSQ